MRLGQKIKFDGGDWILCESAIQNHHQGFLQLTLTFYPLDWKKWIEQDASKARCKKGTK